MTRNPNACGVRRIATRRVPSIRGRLRRVTLGAPENLCTTLGIRIGALALGALVGAITTYFQTDLSFYAFIVVVLVGRAVSRRVK